MLPSPIQSPLAIASARLAGPSGRLAQLPPLPRGDYLRGRARRLKQGASPREGHGAAGVNQEETPRAKRPGGGAAAVLGGAGPGNPHSVLFRKIRPSFDKRRSA